MIEIAIVGTGPYGLSIGAHLRHMGIPFRIFGRPMDSWLAHMPKDMFLKSDGFASNLYDPDSEYTLKHFCAERKIPYADLGVPVHLDTFTSYGLAFRDRMVPEVEDTLVTKVDRVPGGFSLRLETGETLTAKRVVLAVGITHFQFTPGGLANLPAQFLSHSYNHHVLDRFKGLSVVVLGGGSSAIDLAGLLHKAGADTRVVARRKELKFHDMLPVDRKRSLWEQIRRPQSGLGPGIRSRFYTDAPGLFRHLPTKMRLKTVQTALGPSGGWFARDMVMGKVALTLGSSVEGADVVGGKARLRLRTTEGATQELTADQVIAATGYKVDLGRLAFLSAQIQSEIKALERTPVLSSSFESSVPGLYFTGIAAANSFGPVMRFAFGAGFTAGRLTQKLAKSVARGPAFVSVPRTATVAK